MTYCLFYTYAGTTYVSGKIKEIEQINDSTSDRRKPKQIGPLPKNKRIIDNFWEGTKLKWKEQYNGLHTHKLLVVHKVKEKDPHYNAQLFIEEPNKNCKMDGIHRRK